MQSLFPDCAKKSKWIKDQISRGKYRENTLKINFLNRTPVAQEMVLSTDMW